MEREIDLSYKTTNIFDLLEPDSLSCEVYGVQPDRSVIWIDVHDNNWNRKASLVFRSAYFFDGPTEWSGANFCVAERSLLIALLEQLGYAPPKDFSSFDEVVSKFALLYVQTSRYRVRMLVTGAYISNTIPSEFKTKP